MLAAVESAGFYRSTGNTVWWGDAAPRSERFADGATGYQVQRADFDQLLRDLAVAAGATLSPDAMVRAVELPELTDGLRGTSRPDETPPRRGTGCARIEYEDLDRERRSLTASFALDCSGRAGVIARRGLRQHEAAPATLALVGVWQRDAGWQLQDETHTLVETYRDGWAWSVPLSRSVRYFTAMVDPRATDLERDKQLSVVYRHEIEKTRQFSKLTASATLRGEPWGCDASLYSARRYAGPHFLLLGDAASFIDPLSSFGVKKALASAWMAGVVVHTCLGKPDMVEPALELFSTNEHDIYTGFRRQSARYFTEAGSEHDHPFWTGRSTATDGIDIGAMQDPDVERLRRESRSPEGLPGVEAECGHSATAVEPLSDGARPGISGREVVLEDRLIFPGPLVARNASGFCGRGSPGARPHGRRP